MCGRMNVHDQEAVQAFLDDLGLSLTPQRFVPRYNLAPTDPVHAVFAPQSLELAQMRWGLLPRNPNQRGVLINARAETAWHKPAFREGMRLRRAVIPVNGFYEWQRRNGERLPFYITGQEPVMALAGIYEIDRDGELRCCVLTTCANDDMRELHDRMPVVLAPTGIEYWLRGTERGRLQALIDGAQSQRLQSRRVSTFVNDARHDGPQCMVPLAA